MGVLVTRGLDARNPNSKFEWKGLEMLLVFDFRGFLKVPGSFLSFLWLKMYVFEIGKNYRSEHILKPKVEV